MEKQSERYVGNGQMILYMLNWSIRRRDDKEWDMVEEVLNTFLADDSNFA